MQECIMHIDMDAFFASVEELLNPALKGKPVIVGHEHRGVVCAASYAARRFGVHSAMPTARAKKLCPHGVFIEPKHNKYSEYSRKVMDILKQFSPLVEQASVDEAYLDASGLAGIFGPPREMGYKIKAAVFENTGLTCSVGIAPVKFLAKIASDMQKPDGLTVIEQSEVRQFLNTLPIARIPGVGPRTHEEFILLGVKTVGDVLALPAGVVERRLGKMGSLILRRAQGIDESKVEPYTVPKSEGREHTLDQDTRDKDLLKRYLLKQSEKVMSGVRKLNTAGRTVTLKVKFSDFKQITRSHSLDLPTNSTRLVYATACALLDELDLPMPVRLIGVTLSNFVWSEGEFVSKHNALLPGIDCFIGHGAKGAGIEFCLPSYDKDKDSALDLAIDKVRAKFGQKVLKRAELINDEQD